MTPEELAFYQRLIDIEEVIDYEPTSQDLEDYSPEEEAEWLEEMNAYYFSTRI